MEVRNVSYYKTNKDIIFNDGFELKSGTKVQFNFSEGQIFNVQYERNNEKRIFWVHSSDLTLIKTVKERWLKKKLEEYNIDLNEKWLEYEKKLQQDRIIKSRVEADGKSVDKRKQPGKKKKVATSSSRIGSKKRVPGKSREKRKDNSIKKRTIRKTN